MKETLLAMLILASSGQEQGVDQAPVEPPRFVHIIRVPETIDDKICEITLSVPAWPAPGADGRVRRVMNVDMKAAVLERENLDRWIFGVRIPEAERFNHLDDRLFVKVQAASRIHKLTESQRAKLRVAGKGDIKRFLDQVEDERASFEIDRMSLKTGLAALRRLKPLSDVYDKGPFGDGSLFAKTLRRIKDDRATSN
jgi:hypothetical protein